MRTIGSCYRQHPPEGEYDAIVIGSGIGGLTAAALLAKAGGRKVLVLERHYTAGGFTHSFRRPGYEWDVGIHYVGQVGDPRSRMRAAFDYVTEGRLDWSPMPDVYDRIRIEDRNYEFPSGIERFRAQLSERFPEEKEAIGKYLGAITAAARASYPYFAEKSLPAPVSRILGRFLRKGFLRWADRTTAEVLAAFTQNRELIGLLTAQWIDYGLPPSQSSFGMHAIVVHQYLDGGAYPVGGGSAIAAAIAPLIERAGGAILVSADVSEILLDRNRSAVGVRMADGRELRAKTIISDAGAWNTFTHLLPPEAAEETGVEELKGVQPSMSHICLYAGIRQEQGDEKLSASNLIVHPGPDHDTNLARFEADPSAPFPSLFLSSPSAKDPSFQERHPGSATLEVAGYAPYRWFARWAESRWKRRAPEYEEFKEEMTARLVAEMETHLPAVRGRVGHAELSTPLTTRHFANYEHGEMYGIGATPERFRLRSLGARTAIRNLFLAGQDAATLGVPSALVGGAAAASLILRRNLISTMMRPATKAA